MFRVKICGITTSADAQLAAEAGADAIGLNFYALSPRCVPLDTAAEIARVLPERVARVGVFVGMPLTDVLRIAEEVELSAIQLHGDETPEAAAEILQATHRPVYIAIRCRETSLAQVGQYLARLLQLVRLPDAVLLDAYHTGAFGGTGQKLDWDAVHAQRHELGKVPLVLAGGLNPTNVADAISRARPDAVDVASGVESSPGRKDPLLVRRFIFEAIAAYQR